MRKQNKTNWTQNATNAPGVANSINKLAEQKMNEQPKVCIPLITITLKMVCSGQC